MDPDFREPFLNGMPIDITEASFDRIVRYASGCTDVQQPDVIAIVIQHALDNLKELSQLLDNCNGTTQMRVLKDKIKGTLNGLPQEQRAALLNEVLETLNEGSLNDD